MGTTAAYHRHVPVHPATDTSGHDLVAGGIVLGAALIFGYRYYDSYRNDRALRAAAQFDDMTSAPITSTRWCAPLAMNCAPICSE